MTRPDAQPDLPADPQDDSQDPLQDSTPVQVDTLGNGTVGERFSEAKAVAVEKLLHRRPQRHSRLETVSTKGYGEFLLHVFLGAYDHVSATCLGVSEKTFYKWIARAKAHEGYLETVEAVEAGEIPEDILNTLEPDPLGGLYLRFAQDVAWAKGEARLVTEMQVKKDDPKWWLTHSHPKRDWSPNVELQIGGHVEHTGRIQHEFPASEATVVGALAIFQELGFIEPTEEGKQVFDALLLPDGDEDLSSPAKKLLNTMRDHGDGRPED